MDRSSVLTLIAESYIQDAIGQLIPTETERDVFCDIQSATRQEWNAAGERGFKAEYIATIFSYDYEGEEICELNGKRLSVYRTYTDERTDSLELYLGSKVGTE